MGYVHVFSSRKIFDYMVVCSRTDHYSVRHIIYCLMVLTLEKREKDSNGKSAAKL